MHFADRVCQAVAQKDSRILVGLDPRMEMIPQEILAGRDPANPADCAEAIYLFNKMIIDCLADLAVGVKPQLAFYEAYGSHGWQALERTNRYAREAGLIVVCDAKRNDIGATAESYAEAFLARKPEDGWGVFCDALTVNPYLGSDGLRPFIAAAAANEKGLFALVKTSNASSSELQDLTVGDKPLYEIVAANLNALCAGTYGEKGYSFVGAVTGATFPEAGLRLRNLMPGCLFLVPGYGAQGGKAEDVKSFFDHNGLGALVNASRSIIGAGANSASQSVAAACIRREAAKMREAINGVLNSPPGPLSSAE